MWSYWWSCNFKKSWRILGGQISELPVYMWQFWKSQSQVLVQSVLETKLKSDLTYIKVLAFSDIYEG